MFSKVIILACLGISAIAATSEPSPSILEAITQLDSTLPGVLEGFLGTGATGDNIHSRGPCVYGGCEDCYESCVGMSI